MLSAWICPHMASSVPLIWFSVHLVRPLYLFIHNWPPYLEVSDDSQTCFSCISILVKRYSIYSNWKLRWYLHLPRICWRSFIIDMITFLLGNYFVSSFLLLAWFRPALCQQSNYNLSGFSASRLASDVLAAWISFEICKHGMSLLKNCSLDNLNQDKVYHDIEVFF